MNNRNIGHLLTLLLLVIIECIFSEQSQNLVMTTSAPQFVNKAPTEDWKEEEHLGSPEKIMSMKVPVKAKGIYVSARSAGGSRFAGLLDLINKTELNSMVIDVKEDEGKVTYRSFIPLVNEVKADNTQYISDIDQLIQTLHDHHVYPIARIVCFKDPFLAGKKVHWAMQKKSGGIWRDSKGVLWIDPYRKEIWDYNVQLAKEAAKKGFKEIQFDYVRFPSSGKKVDREVAFYNQNGKPKQQVIADFLTYARKELQPYHVYISVDVFGMVTSVNDDMGIGQKWELVSTQVDYISPMMYPSHYGNGLYGIRIPDTKPYATIRAGLLDARQKDQRIRNHNYQTPAIIRPWYQDFTAKWVKGHIVYGPKQVLDQVNAGKDTGIDQYLLWDAGNSYSEAAWRK
ncbi:putative glycoside hydrolase [Brevibacillus sp. SYSU BS000544]|uniref:putative glycoside hydrolase n=1 Tax=Brevibacillus sp. SYSU BS000544 TaxID=3416443 RepID=UPI003CE48900